MERLWQRVGELANRAPLISDLRHHKLHLVAAAQMRERGEVVPDELRHAERYQAALSLSAVPMLRRIRAATDAPIIVMKGVVAAELWANPRVRPWTDMDIFVGDGEAVQAALLASGFVEVGDPEDYTGSHHLRPVAHPLLPFAVEVHRRPKWPTERCPSFEEVLEAAEPARFGVPDVFAPSPAHHAVLTAGHAWAHDPLGSIGPLVDIAVMTHAAGPETAAAVARSWGIERLWASTSRAVDRLLLSDTWPPRPPVWQRHLYEARPRTVFEGHVERLVAPVVAAPAVAAPFVAARAVWNTLRPWPGEGWSSKVARSRLSLHHASMREDEHHEALLASNRNVTASET